MATQTLRQLAENDSVGLSPGSAKEFNGFLLR
jgi:hypothetical protein